MKEYRWLASRVNVNWTFRAQLAAAMSRRLQDVPDRQDMILMIRSAWSDAGYCIDAPDEMPGGSCVDRDVDGDYHVPEQRTIYRE